MEAISIWFGGCGPRVRVRVRVSNYVHDVQECCRLSANILSHGLEQRHTSIIIQIQKVYFGEVVYSYALQCHETIKEDENTSDKQVQIHPTSNR